MTAHNNHITVVHMTINDLRLKHKEINNYQINVSEEKVQYTTLMCSMYEYSNIKWKWHMEIYK